MILEIAIGDAYGAGFEFSSREKISQYNTLNGFVAHDLGIPAGHYTDDTQMTLAVAEVLLGGSEWSSQIFADAFVRCYKRDPRPGYAKGFQALLEQCADGTSLRETIRPQSRRNGAAMRAVPLGLIGDVKRLKEAAQAQAVVTHDTPEGIISAQIVALMAHVLLYESAALQDVPSLVERHTGFVLANGSLSGNTGGEGEIRRKIVEADLVDCIVAMPGQLFFTTGIPVCLWFLTRDKTGRNLKRGGRKGGRKGETLFIDARRRARPSTCRAI